MGSEQWGHVFLLFDFSHLQSMRIYIFLTLRLCCCVAGQNFFSVFFGQVVQTHQGVDQGRMISNRFSSGGPGRKKSTFPPSAPLKKRAQNSVFRLPDKESKPISMCPGCHTIRKFEQPFNIPEKPFKISYCFSGNVSTFCSIHRCQPIQAQRKLF